VRPSKVSAADTFIALCSISKRLACICVKKIKNSQFEKKIQKLRKDKEKMPQAGQIKKKCLKCSLELALRLVERTAFQLAGAEYS
jgi:hypothetical protein